MHDHLPLICFVVCDNGPAAHFAAFVKSLAINDRFCIDIYANDVVLAKFKDLQRSDRINLFHFILDGLNDDGEQGLATDIINNCIIRGAKTIIMDIANKFNTKLQIAFNSIDLALYNIRLWSYYDNPENYVPGGYSIRCRETIKLSQNILFANTNLIQNQSKIFSLPNVPIDLNDKTVQTIGYYPIETAENLYQRRQIERKILREKYDWNNVKYLFVYFGGNNQVYFEQAFPALLSLLSSIDKEYCEDTLFLLHQHPAAKLDNRDGLLLQKWLLKNSSIQITLSPLTTDEAQIVADGVLYYQTSMAAQFALMGLPIMQVGHKIYDDILVKHDICQVATNSSDFLKGLKILKEKSQLINSIEQKQMIYDAIGYTYDWIQNLENVILN